MFPWFTVAKYGIPFIIGGMLFGGFMWKIQDWRYSGDRAKLGACESANIENDTTILALKDSILKADKSCSERLANKDSTIKRLRDIDNLRGYDEAKPDSGNPLRDQLNIMFGNSKN